jgi:hypothetical protein
LADGYERVRGAIFQNHYEAYNGLPARGLEIDQFPPLSREFIKRYSHLEEIVLTMMNKRFGRLGLDERKRFYYTMLRYWSGVLRKYRPELVIFNNIPHSVYDYIVYQLSRDLAVKTIMFENTWVSDRMIIYNDWREGSRALQKELQENQGKNFSLKDLSEDLQEYYKRHTEPDSDATPVYMKEWKKKFSGFNLFLNKLNSAGQFIKDGTIFQRAVSCLVKQFKPNLKKEYLSLQITPDFNRHFIYVPLGFQPERTTTVMGDVFADQILMLEMLAYCLPAGWFLYVKEHPSQWWLSGVRYSNCRYRGYYQKIAQIKNVRIVPVQTNTYQLINKAKAVAVVTGSAGWEAILRGKPALVFGYPWFKDFPALFRIDNAQTCQAALKKIEQGEQVRTQDVINYLRCFDRVTIHAFSEPFLEKVSNLNKKQSMDNIAKAMLAEIENNQ